MDALPWYGFALSWSLTLSIVAFAILAAASLVARRNDIWFALVVLVALYAFGAPMWAWGVAVVLALALYVPPVRQVVLARPLLWFVESRKMMPRISATERMALDAGSTWIETELFSGHPDFHKIRSQPYPDLTAAEKAFLEGPIEELCALVNPWDIREERDLPEAAWEFMRRERIFAVSIPKEYGGHGFSATFFTAMVGKIASRSGGLAVTAMVPNTVGPAELILTHGTLEQKTYYLPRLARGEDIPCFGLTEAEAGSDAGAVQSRGEVFRGEDGRLYIRLNFKKRYISLASIATLLGLAVKLRDPNNLLGKGVDVGITSLLVPAHLPGIVRGTRHDPLGAGFPVAPLEGRDVVVSVDTIIGGPAHAGGGWKMLIDALAAGRGLSLPAYASGQVKYAARIVGAYSAIRRQFGMPIGHFEGIEEPLARIGGFAYVLDAVRRWNGGAVDAGFKSAVVSAISKHRATELARMALNDTMDVFGGRGVCEGPRNPIAPHYLEQAIPVTVEGANILTRSMMIFGQGAFRCHPFAYREVRAMEQHDVAGFDKAFWGHAWHVAGNVARCVLFSLTHGWAAVSTWGLPNARDYRRMTRASAAFAVLGDLAMFSYGGKLKQAEKVTGRLADVFSWLYFVSAALRRFEAEGQRADHRAHARWIAEYGFGQIDLAFQGLYRNMKVPLLSPVLRFLVAPWARMNALSSGLNDTIGHQVAASLLVHGPTRDSLTREIFTPQTLHEPSWVIENAFRLTQDCAPLVKKLEEARLQGKIKRLPLAESIVAARTAGVLSSEEASRMESAFNAYWEAIQVDAFPPKTEQDTLRSPIHERKPA